MRLLLPALVLIGFSIASCTAILGGVPTSGGSGGAGGGGASMTASGQSSGRAVSTSGAGGSGGAGMGTGGTGDMSGNGGQGGGGAVCITQGGMCGSAASNCCTGLSCSNGTCQANMMAGVSSSSGMTTCTTCNEVILHGAMPINLCLSSKTAYGNLNMCFCNACPMDCSHACNGTNETPTMACLSCAITSCPMQYSACKDDMG
jgi:hypothetical protein